jgi:hypothetical protein
MFQEFISKTASILKKAAQPLTINDVKRIKRSVKMWFGVFLVSLGIMYLLDNLDVIHVDVWDMALPLLIICVGLGVICRSGIFGCRKEK